MCTLYSLASGLVLGALGSHRAPGCAGLPPCQAVQAAVTAFSYNFLQRKASSGSIWKPVFLLGSQLQHPFGALGFS